MKKKIRDKKNLAKWMNILLFPVNLLKLFSKQGGFYKNPILGSKFLNRLGLHALRLCLAHLIYFIRYFYVFRLLDKGQRKSFTQNGYLYIPNFLPSDLFAQLKKDMQNFNSHGYYFTEGTTTTWCAPFSKINCEAYVGMRQLLKDVENATDPQYWLHSDTFFPVIKLWIFLDEVTPDNGPFEYIPGSHHLNLKRIKWEYQRSINYKERNKTIPGDKSPRYTDDDLKYLDISTEQAIQFKVPQNTLVVANTFGLHRRTPASYEI